MKIVSIESTPFHEIQYLSSGRQGIPRHCVLPFYRVFVDSLPVGINVGGVSGIIGNPNRNQRKSIDNYQIALQNVIKKNPDIPVTHMGPNNPNTQDKGEPLIYDLLENTGSGIMLFGHCHWQQPFIEIGNWQVLNLDSRVFVFCQKA